MFNNADKVISALNKQYGKNFVDEAVQEVFQGRAPGRIGSKKEKELKLVANLKKLEAQKAKLVAEQALQQKEAQEAERLAQQRAQQWIAQQQAQRQAQLQKRAWGRKRKLLLNLIYIRLCIVAWKTCIMANIANYA